MVTAAGENLKEFRMEAQQTTVVYVVTRFLSQANRRVLKLLSLKGSFARMVLVCEKGAGTDGSNMLSVSRWPNITGPLKWFGLERLKFHLNRFLYFPSPAVLYTQAAQKKLEQKIKNDLDYGQQICLMTMAPPQELVLIGLGIKQRFPAVRWVIDWQDLWSYDEYYFSHIPEFRQGRVRRLEKEALDTCDLNVVTNQFAHEILREKYEVSESKLRVISHAFDRGEIDGNLSGETQDGPRIDDSIKIGVLGNLFKPPKVPGERVVESVRVAKESGINVTLHIFGDKEAIARFNGKCPEWLVLHGRTSHEESLRSVSRCDFFLLALADLPNSRIIMHAKLPHYLMLGKPILAMVPNGSMAEKIIKETGTGYIISTDEDWGKGLVRVLREFEQGASPLKRNEMEIERYSWGRISQEWVAAICGS